jgi:shikimate dehydrogenase
MKFAVVGDPVEHSRSPAIHNAAFEALGIDADFELRCVRADRFGDVVEDLRVGTLDGVSVTMPHKRNAYDAADSLSGQAVRTRAVNTIVVDDAQLVGHNTDIAGVRYGLSTIEKVSDPPVLILGYGGAAAAALVAVEGRQIHVSGRDESKARLLVDRVGVDAQTVPWGVAVPMASVINATPLGMTGEQLPDGVVERASSLLDMTYGVQRSPSYSHALALGIPASDGLTMLIGQAAEAFELFTGKIPSLFVMEQAARNSGRT